MATRAWYGEHTAFDKMKQHQNTSLEKSLEAISTELSNRKKAIDEAEERLMRRPEYLVRKEHEQRQHENTLLIARVEELTAQLTTARDYIDRLQMQQLEFSDRVERVAGDLAMRNA